MFTGLIEETAQVVSNQQKGQARRLMITAPFTDLKAGESIAVDGVCLTLLPGDETSLMFDVSFETLAKTNLQTLCSGDLINLERAMGVSSRFGGHYVSGHVDTTARVMSVKPVDRYLELTIGPFNTQDLKYLLPKGSITLNGVSLTINTVQHLCITVLLVPHTLSNTALDNCKPGTCLNVEFDYLTRIIAQQTEHIVKEHLKQISCQTKAWNQVSEVNP